MNATQHDPLYDPLWPEEGRAESLVLGQHLRPTGTRQLSEGGFHPASYPTRRMIAYESAGRPIPLEVILIGGPADGRRLAVKDHRPIVVPHVPGRAFDSPIEEVTYFPHRFTQSIGPLRFEAWVATTAMTPAERDAPAVERASLCAHLLRCPWWYPPVRGSRDFDAWWTRAALRMGRPEIDEVAQRLLWKLDHFRSDWASAWSRATIAASRQQAGGHRQDEASSRRSR